jgi:hypothetical protein
MSSVLKPSRYAGQLNFSVMRVQDVEEVVRVEHDAYPFPWTRGNFLDSLANRYEAWVLREADGRLAGYFLLMYAVDDVHLLNITVRVLVAICWTKCIHSLKAQVFIRFCWKLGRRIITRWRFTAMLGFK